MRITAPRTATRKLYTLNPLTSLPPRNCIIPPPSSPPTTPNKMFLRSPPSSFVMSFAAHPASAPSTIHPNQFIKPPWLFFVVLSIVIDFLVHHQFHESFDRIYFSRSGPSSSCARPKSITVLR